MKNNQLRRYGPLAVVGLWGAACFLFFLLKYPYHFFFQEQNQLFLLSREYVLSYFDGSWGAPARLAGDFLTQFYYYVGAGPAILTVCLLTLGDLTRRLLQKVGLRSQWWATVAALAVATLMAVFSLHHHYKLYNIISAIGIAATLLAAAMILQTGWKKRPTRPLALLLAAAAVLAGSYTSGLPRWGKVGKPNFYLEKQLAADNEYYFGHYDRLVSMVESDPQPTQEMKFFCNLAWAARGELPDHLLRLADTDLGTFHQIGPTTPRLVINNMNELYWVLGDMTFCERAAMMSHVFSRDNRNARMTKRLAECALVSQDSLAARKYLRLLSKTLVYAEWAQRNLRKADPRYVQKRAFVPRHDTITVSDNAHHIMVQLLNRNPRNTAALDYMLCSDLLLKDMESFKRDYDNYCAAHPRPKRLYQEALCIYLAGTQAAEEEWKKYIVMPDVAQRFAQYSRQRGSSAFKDSYWYYFDKARKAEME